MWKDFFYYSRSERRAIIVLLAAVLAGVFALWGLRREMPGTVVERAGEAGTDSFMAQIRERKNGHSLRANPRGQSPAVLRPFDPNTADSALLRSVGLSAFVTRNVLRYRASGGVFRTPESFSRVYGLTDSQFVALRPFLKILTRHPARNERSKEDSCAVKSCRPFPSKYPEGTLVSLNQADTSQLKRIPGIGSGLARRIVAYRSRLGGFSDISQLQEIPHVGDSLNRWFRLEGGPYRRLRVNRDGLDRLRSHPYMDFYKARAILEYRRRRGRIKSIRQISLFEEFSDEDIRRLSPYFSFD